MKTIFCCKCAVIVFFLLWPGSGARAGERELLDLAGEFYARGEYYNAVTEILRYQQRYPGGDGYPDSMILMGKSYYRGKNYTRAVEAFLSCHRSFRNSPAGDEGLYLSGFTHLMKGSPLEAMRLHDIYSVTYASGKYGEELDRDRCFASALALDLPGSWNLIGKYRERHRDGKYRADIDRLDGLLREEINRPRRHLWASVLGSIVIPGFGHFYTGNYAAGVLTFLTNALFSFLIYDGWRNHNTFQMVFFSLAEATVYQYNIWSAVRGVDDYNRRQNDIFSRKVRLAITAPF